MPDTVYLPLRPSCNICSRPAEYDARTHYGWWAYLCGACFNEHTDGKLGTGYGQMITTDRNDWRLS